MSTTKSGRVAEVTDDGKAGVVADADGVEYPFVAKTGKDAGDFVLFEVSDRTSGAKTSKFANLE